MTVAAVCPQCGKTLPSDAPQGLCAECLLKAALPGQSALESSATGCYESPATALALEAGVRVKYFGDFELLDEIATTTFGPDTGFPPPGAPPGYLTHITIERVGGVGPWAT